MPTSLIQSVEARAPATIANLGSGFDILGLALADPADVVIAERSAEAGIQIVAIEGDDGQLTRDPTKNTAGVAALYVLDQLAHVVPPIGDLCGARLTIRKGLPLASGLGSSAASAVAGAMAVNALFGSPLSRANLLAACIEGEAAVSGRHADNVAPALFGGIVLVGGLTADQLTLLPIPKGITLTLVTPNVKVPTVEARAVLPALIPLHTMVEQTSAVARLISALYTGDRRKLAQAMEADLVVEPARAHLMPGLVESRAAVKAVGALGLIISGAGPTLCAICDSDSTAMRSATALKTVFNSLNLAHNVYVTRIAEQGATIRILR